MKKNFFMLLGVLVLGLVMACPSQASVTLTDTVDFYGTYTDPSGRETYHTEAVRLIGLAQGIMYSGKIYLQLQIL